MDGNEVTLDDDLEIPIAIALPYFAFSAVEQR